MPISAGGDHTVPLPVIRAIGSTKRPFAVVHFDAHSDTWDTLYGNKYNNATPFRRLIEDALIDPKRLVQIGIRGTLFAQDDLEWALAQGVRIITMDEFEALGRDKLIAEVRDIVADAPLYVTYDVDGLDPVHCPGTGVPEPGGLSMRDSQVIIRGLRGLDVIGGDVCEVSPPLDPAGHTAVNAANLMFEILCIATEAWAARGKSWLVAVGTSVPRNDRPERGGPQDLFYATNSTIGLPTFVRGEGIYFFDAAGDRYIDVSSGAIVNNLGQGNERVLKAMYDQGRELSFTYVRVSPHKPNDELSRRVAELAGPGFERCHFVSGGRRQR